MHRYELALYMNSTNGAQVKLQAEFFVNGLPNKFNIWWRMVLILSNFTSRIYCPAKGTRNAFV